MATFEYSVDGQSITTTKAGRLVSGTIGVNTVKFTFDSSWDGLEKWATFDPNPGKPYKQPLDANGECLIPGEVMGGITLRIGAFGLADGQAYPTVWANKLQMEEGCFIEVPVSDWPEPSPVIEEILEELENKVDKPENATPGNVAIIGSNSNIVDSGFASTSVFEHRYGENILYDAVFTNQTAGQMTVVNTDDDITITNTGYANYTALSTRSGFIKERLTIGKKYRVHAKAEVVSGSPYLLVAIRGVSGNENTIVTSVNLNNQSSGYFEFEMTQYISKLSLFMSWNAQTNGSVAKYSELRIEEVLEDGAIDASARVSIEQIDSEKVDLVVGKNIFNKDDTHNKITGVYVVASTARVSSNASFVSYLLPIIGGKKITTRGTANCHLSFYSRHSYNFSQYTAGAYLSGYISGTSQASNLVGYTVPANAIEMAVSVPATSVGAVQIAYSDEEIPYEPYRLGLPYSIILDPPDIQTVTYTEYDIYADGTGDYSDLLQCILAINAAGDASKNNQYIINLYPGTHDIVTMYGGESELTTYGLFLPDYVALKGIGDMHNIILQGELTTANNNWSVLNLRNHCSIENITIKSKNARYTIHDDWQNDAVSDRHIKDVIFIGDKCAYGSVYGSGVKGASTWNFENCIFDAKTAAANGTPGNALSVHNNVNITKPSFITFDNCRLLNRNSDADTYKTLRLLSMTTGSANGTVYVTLKGCKVDGIKLSENDAAQYGAGCSFYVNGYGNVNALGVTVESSDGIDYSDRVDLI